VEQFCYKLGVILSNIAAMSEEYHSEVSILHVCVPVVIHFDGYSQVHVCPVLQILTYFHVHEQSANHI